MANASKNKGDRAEREAVAYLLGECPDLCRPRSRRMLGAGRAEDVGDLYVFPDVAVQVRAYALGSIGQAVRTSARDAVEQARNGEMEFALGLVPFPRARPGTVRWIACVERWPSTEPIAPIDFNQVARALAWLRDDEGPHGYRAYPRTERLAVLSGGNTAPVLLAPAEAWIEGYRQERGTLLPAHA